MLISIAYNVCKIASYTRSALFIRKQIKKFEADIVINFYELLVGLTYALIPPKIPYICIAHQYILLHPDFKFPPGRRAKSLMLRFFTRVTCVRAKKLLALSIHEMKNCSNEKIVVIPPLLRKDVLDVSPEPGDYLHGYMLNDTYSEEVIRFHKKHPEVKMHFFWDRKGVEETTVIDENLSFHQLNDKLFIQYMKGCKAYATTAGFESVCEAMYLGKPVLMVPTHIEQECNAYDAAAAGAGIVANEFDLEKLLNYLPEYTPKPEFKTWVHQSESLIMSELVSLSNK